MAIVFADRVKVRAYTTGTGAFTLDAVTPGFQSFEAIGDGNECYYGIEDHAGNWEVGRGTYTSSGTTLSRDTVIDSSNSGSLVDFPAGGKSVYCTIPSSVAGSIVASASSDSFKTISVATQSNVVADSSTDILTLVAGTGINIVTNAGSDTITFSSTASSLGSIEAVGSTLSTTDSSGIIIDQAVNVTSDLEVGGDIIPTTDLGGNLGSPTNRFKELYLSGSTINLGGATISTVDGVVTIPNLKVSNIVDSQGNSLFTSTASYVAVNVDGIISGSTDGVNWTEYNSNLTGIEYVAVGPYKVVYVADSSDEFNDGDSLWYADTYNAEPVEVTDISFRNYNQIKYFKSISKFVAVGSNSTNDQPGFVYSSDGVNWTEVEIDSTFLSTVEGYTSGAQFEDIEENDLGFFITTDNTTLGGFFVSDVTDILNATTYVDTSNDYNRAVWASNGMFTGWHVFDTGTGSWDQNSEPDPRNGTFEPFAVDDVSTVFEELIGYDPSISDIVIGDYNGVSTIVIATNDGQIQYYPVEPNGPFVSIPKPYTGTITAWTDSATSAITISGTGPDALGEKFTVTGSSVAGYNGTYYIDDNNNTVYTDLARTTPFDTTGLDPFTGEATITWSHGQYIDALHYSNGVFYVGNDNEEIFTSTDGGATWTEVVALSGSPGEPDYLNDIDSYTTTESITTANTGNFTFSNNTIVNSDGMLIQTDRGTLAIGTDMEVPGVPTHFHIAFNGSNISPPSSDLFVGDDFNYVKIEAYGGVEVGTDQRTEGSVQQVWQFGTDGSLTLPGEPTYVLGETEGGIQLASDYAVILTANTVDFENEHSFIVYNDGTVRLPGATVSQPATPTPGIYSVGAATAITVTNTPNTNWTFGTGIFANGIGFDVTVDGSGNATVTSISQGGTGHSVGETFGPIVGSSFGGSSPADDMYFEVTAIDAPVFTALDLTKQTQILNATLSSGGYSLADGTEGQIMYFVPASGSTGVSNIEVANARVLDIGGSYLPVDVANYDWLPFTDNSITTATIAMAIFADGAWCLRGGATD